MNQKINKPTLELLDKLSKESFFELYKTVLIGGTALAYHVGHRISYDLDICFPEARTLPDLSQVLDYYQAKKIEFDQYTIDKFKHEGGDIDHYHQRFSIDGIKVDFTVNPATNIFEDEYLAKCNGIKHGNILIADINTLFKLKSLLVLDRNKIRDLYDVVYLIEHENFTGKQFIDIIKSTRFTYNDEYIIGQIKNKKTDMIDEEFEPIIEPVMKIKSLDELKAILLDKIKSHNKTPTQKNK